MPLGEFGLVSIEMILSGGKRHEYEESYRLLNVSSGFTLPSWPIGAAEQLAGATGMTVAHKCYCHTVTEEDVFTLENLSISLAHPDPEALLQCWGLSRLSSNTIKTITLVKHVSMRLLEALDFLHSQCRVIHTGKTFQCFGSSF